jgi:hypothetical protein
VKLEAKMQSGTIRTKKQFSGGRIDSAGGASRRVKHQHFVHESEKAKNRTKASVETEVEHAFRILMRIFGFEKMGYRGIKKTTIEPLHLALPWRTCMFIANGWQSGRREGHPKIRAQRGC